MNKIDKLIQYQERRDKLNEEIEKQFSIIIMSGYTIEEKRMAYKEHKRLVIEYLNFVKGLV